MAETSSGSLMSAGGGLLGAIVGAFTTIVLGVGTYTFQLELTGQRIVTYLVVGFVVAVVSGVYVTRAE